MSIRQRSAQSMIEYSVLAVVVIMAIIFGGPFLVKSINARFMILDNNVRDSMEENIRQAHQPTANPVCSCTPNTPDPTTWTAGSCHIGSCGPTERLYFRTCTRALCAPERACVADPSCCDTPVSNLICGQTIDDTSLVHHGCFSRQATDPAFDSSFIGHCLSAAGADVGCAVGEREWKMNCGVTGSSGTVVERFGCKAETACLPSCQYKNGVVADVVLCPGDNVEDASTMLPELDRRLTGGETPAREIGSFDGSETPSRRNAYKIWRTYVKPGKCNSSRYCESYCNKDCNVPSADGTRCIPKLQCVQDEHFLGGLPKGSPLTYSTIVGTPHQINLWAHAQKMNLIAICLDASDNIIQQLGNVIVPNYAAAISDPLGTYTATPDWAFVMNTSCVANRMYIKVWADPSASEPNPGIGYQICE